GDEDNRGRDDAGPVPDLQRHLHAGGQARQEHQLPPDGAAQRRADERGDSVRQRVGDHHARRQDRVRREPVADDLPVHGTALRQRRRPARCGHLPGDPAHLPAGVRPPRRVPGRVADIPQGDLHLPLEANVVTSARTVTRRLAALSRRRLLLGAGAAAGVAAVPVAGAGIRAALGAGKAANVPLGPQPAGLPARQHAWDAYLAADADGNPIAPKFDRLLFFDVNGDPSPAHARLLAAGLRTLERDYRWLHSGLVFTAAWGPGYFSNVLGVSSPVPPATALSGFEQPVIDDYHLCLHLACDDESRLPAAQARAAPRTP